MFRCAALLMISVALAVAQGPEPQHPWHPKPPAAGASVETGADWIDIMPDASFKGWTRLLFGRSDPMAERSQWRVDDRVLICEGDGGHEWLRWDRELGDFIFQAEWRFTKLPGEPRYNSGILVRASADGKLWHQAQAGSSSAGYLFGETPVGGAVKRINLRKDGPTLVRPAGEWNSYELRAAGRTITLTVNGEVASEFTECEVPRGYIGLEAEGYRIEFRNLRVKPLVPKVE